MPVVGVDVDVLRDPAGGLAVVVERGEDGRRRADLVHQPDREERRRGRPPSQVDAVEVAERAVRGLLVIPPRSEVLGDLHVRRLVRELGRPPEVAEERHIGGGADQVDSHQRRQSGSREREAAALTGSGDQDGGRIDERTGRGRLEQPDRVGVHPAEVVRVRVGDAGRHDTGRVGDTGVDAGVGRRVEAAGAPALAPGVHDEMRPAGLRPPGVLLREPPADRIALVLHHGRQRAGGAARHVQPGLHLVAVEPGERHVVGVDQCELVVDLALRRDQVVPSCFVDGLPPEVVEVLGLGHLGTIVAQRGQVEIEEWHGIRA